MQQYPIVSGGKGGKGDKKSEDSSKATETGENESGAATIAELMKTKEIVFEY